MALFQQGDPINVESLNALDTRLVSLEGNLNALTSQTKGISGQLASGLPIIRSGQTDAISITNGFGSIGFTVPDLIASDNPVVLVSCASPISAKQTVSVTVSPDGSHPKYKATVTGTGISKIFVNWVAVGTRAI